MNSLETFLSGRTINVLDAMNQLQGAGIVSDLAVLPADVAETDAKRAVRWLSIGREDGLFVPPANERWL